MEEFSHDFDNSQKVTLRGTGDPQSLYGFNVLVAPSAKSAVGEQASPKVRVTTITNQSWESSGNHGNMVASNKDYIAYVLATVTGYVVRVIVRSNKDRTLLKGFVGRVLDIAFAHSTTNKLAVVDEGGNVYVYDFDSCGGDVTKMSSCLKVHIRRSSQANTLAHRLVWCPSVDDDDDALVLAVAHGEMGVVYDVAELMANFASGITLLHDKIKCGKTVISSAHEGGITDMSLSPDASVLATAGKDGHVKFWKVNNDTVSECLHDYIPHNGRSVTRLIFCDNHTEKDHKFLITGSENNSEIKIWCTVRWKCLQTIKFHSGGDIPRLILALDDTASYLLVADSNRMVLYIMPVYQAGEVGDASFTSITEYLLTQNILSFNISGHAPISEDSDESDGEDDKPFNSRRTAVWIEVHCVQKKSMQELSVRFDPPDLTGIPPPPPDAPTDTIIPIATNVPMATDISMGTNVSLATDETDVIIPIATNVPNTIIPIATVVSPAITDDDTSVPIPMTNVPIPMTNVSIPMTTMPSLDMLPPLSDGYYGPGQTSPSVKLLSPDAFLSGPGVLKSPSDFKTPLITSSTAPSAGVYTEDLDVSITESAESESKESSLTAAMVTLPLGRVQEHNGDDELILPTTGTTPTSTVTTPTAMSINNPFPSAFSETTPTTDVAPPTIDVATEPWHNMVPLSVKCQAVTIVTNVISNALSIVGRSGINDTVSHDAGINDTVSHDVSPLNDITSFALPPRDIVSPLQDISPSSQDIVSPSQDIVSPSQDIISPSQDISVPQDTRSAGHDVSPSQVVTPPQDMVNDNFSDSQLDNSDIEREIATNADDVTGSHGNSDQPSSTNALLKLIFDKLSQQEQQMELLRQENHSMYERVSSDVAATLSNNNTTQMIMMEDALKTHHQQFEHMIKERLANDSKRFDKLPQTLANTLTAKVDKTVKHEISKTVVPAMRQATFDAQDSLQQITLHKLASTEEAIKMAVTQMLHVDVFADTLCRAIVVSLQQILKDATESVFKTIVLPAFERSCQQMFVQIDKAFREGTSDYVQQIHDSYSHLQTPAITQLTSVIQSLPASMADTSAPLVTTLQHVMHQELSPVLPRLEQVIQDVVRKEMLDVVDKLATTTTTGSARQHEELKHDVDVLLADKLIEKAFNLALSTSDLHLVSYVCSRVSPEEVFDSNTQCPLSQPVLLSLIQQLAVDLSDNTELKIRYLEHSILSLDPGDSVTSIHLPHVMRLLGEQIVKTQDMLQQSGECSSQLSRAMKRVRMLSEHVCRDSSGKK